jgi:hypothetical protein
MGVCITHLGRLDRVLGNRPLNNDHEFQVCHSESRASLTAINVSLPVRQHYPSALSASGTPRNQKGEPHVVHTNGPRNDILCSANLELSIDQVGWDQHLRSRLSIHRFKDATVSLATSARNGQ